LPLVSIILPTNNRIELLKKSVSSVYQQTFENWELLIIYDKSNDGTEEYLLDLQNADDRIVLVRTEKSVNPGISAYLNKGIIKSKGKYIARLDDDDIWCHDQKIKIQVDFFEKKPDYVLTGGGEIMTDNNNKVLYKFLKTENDAEIRKNALLSCPFEHTTVMFRKDAAECAGYYKPFKVCEDWEFFLNLGITGKFYNFPEYFVRYLQGNQNISVSNALQKEIAVTEIQIIRMYKDYYPNYSAGITLHSLQYLYSFFPPIVKKPLRHFLRFIKRSI
jgi:glycosyltransferase involved in cell wall biosynthesis